MRSIQSAIEQRAGDFADKAYNALVVTLTSIISGYFDDEHLSKKMVTIDKFRGEMYVHFRPVFIEKISEQYADNKIEFLVSGVEE